MIPLIILAFQRIISRECSCKMLCSQFSLDIRRHTSHSCSRISSALTTPSKLVDPPAYKNRTFKIIFKFITTQNRKTFGTIHCGDHQNNQAWTQGGISRYFAEITKGNFWKFSKPSKDVYQFISVYKKYQQQQTDATQSNIIISRKFK